MLAAGCLLTARRGLCAVFFAPVLLPPQIQIADFGLARFKTAISSDARTKARRAASVPPAVPPAPKSSRPVRTVSLLHSSHIVLRFPLPPGSAAQAGTPGWQAPELYDDSETGGHTFPVDAFAMGVVMWEMATRKEPFAGMSAMTARRFLAASLHDFWLPLAVCGNAYLLHAGCFVFHSFVSPSWRADHVPREVQEEPPAVAR